MGRGFAGAVRHPRVDDAHRLRVVERGIRRDEDHDLRPQGTHRGHRGRPAGSAVRPDVRRAGVGEKHLRHGLLPADEQRGKAHHIVEQPADDHRHGRSATRSTTRSKGASSSAGRSCSGCATGWGSSARRPKSRPWPLRYPTPTASISCPRSRGWQPRTGISTPGAPSAASAAARRPRISPARRWRASPTRRWTSWAPCSATRGVTLGELKVDGGAARNNLLMQFQADLLDDDASYARRVTETTALGAAYLAGLAVGYWGSIGRNPAAMAGGARIRTHGRPLADREGRRRVGRRRTAGYCATAND